MGEFHARCQALTDTYSTIPQQAQCEQGIYKLKASSGRLIVNAQRIPCCAIPRCHYPKKQQEWQCSCGQSISQCRALDESLGYCTYPAMTAKLVCWVRFDNIDVMMDAAISEAKRTKYDPTFDVMKLSAQTGPIINMQISMLRKISSALRTFSSE